jgi:hypothetical protein
VVDLVVIDLVDQIGDLLIGKGDLGGAPVTAPLPALRLAGTSVP